MWLHRIGFTLALAFLALVGASVEANPNTQKTEALLQKIDASFSELKTGMSEEEALKLENVKIIGKLEDGLTIIDSAGVEHDFYDGMWQKLVQIEPSMPKKPLKAMSIGMARSPKEVVAAIRKFTGQKQMDCIVNKKIHNTSGTRKFGSKTFCKQYFPGTDGAYVWASFNTKDQLTTVGFQAWDPF